MTDAIADNLISDPRPRLAFLLGDCTGIGPELVATILHQRRMAEYARLVVASSESGRLTGETLAHAIKMAQRGEIDGITFAPLNKRAMYDGGWRLPDEHKMFA